MNDRIETVSSALFHSVSPGFFVLAAVFALIVGVTVVFVIREIGHDRP